MDVRTDSPCVLQDFVPFGSAAQEPRKSSILSSSFSSRAHVSIQGGPPPSFLHVKGRDWERIEREERRKNVMEMEKSTETISRFHTRERMYAPSDIRARNSRAECAVGELSEQFDRRARPARAERKPSAQFCSRPPSLKAMREPSAQFDSRLLRARPHRFL